jgi:diguanylate cyclase (GGDEF)-like protein/PAS domain S-box-containing protein
MVSNNFQDMVGFPAAEMTGKTMGELFPPELAAKMEADDWKVASEGQVLVFTEELDGRHYSTVKFPIVQSGRTLLAGYSIDITERLRVEQTLRDSENHYQRLAGTVPAMLYDYVLLPDQSERFLYVGPACQDILGVDAHELEADPHRFWQLVHPDDRERLARENQLAFHNGEQSFATEVRIVTPGGTMKWLYIGSRPSSARVEGRPVWSGVILDVTGRKRLELIETGRARVLELLAQARPLPILLDAIVRAMEATNPEVLCSILLLDPAGRRLLSGAAPSLPEFYNQAVHGLEIGPKVGSCGAAAWSGHRVIVEDIQTHPNWAEFREIATKAGLAACWSEPIHSAAGKVLGTFAIYHHAPGYPQSADLKLIEQFANLAAIAIERSRTLEELDRYRALLEEQVRTDPLTGLANRRSLDERAEVEWRRALRHGNSIAILMIDIDLFKNYNDHYGHVAGDDCLRRVAQCIATNLTRADDFVARYGGEEFVVLLADTPLEQAVRVAEFLRTRVLQMAIPHDEAPADGKVSVSIGVTSLSPLLQNEVNDPNRKFCSPADIMTLYEMADSALS